MDLNQVTLFSTDVVRAVEFYKTLGFNLIVDSQPRYVRFECKSGESTFSIHETAEKPVNNAVVLYFECENVDSEYGRHSSAGIEFEFEPTDQNWLWREAGFKDPDENRLILFSAGKNRKFPPSRIGG